jgi:simple sugar transport system ATP-binding protein
MDESGLTVDPNRRVASLGVGERQRVEILKVLYRGARILVLDEPTAVLAPPEAEQLFEVLRRLQSQGLSVIFISHKLGEVAALADRVAVLRAGRKVADQPVAGADKAALALLMVGREVSPSLRVPQPPGPPLLIINRVRVPGERGRAGLVDVSLAVHAGEIVGVAGVSGNGQAELAGLLAGTRTPSSGSVRLGGAPIPPGPAGAIAAGIGRIPEDRHREGAVGNLSILENLSSQDVRSWGFLRFGRMREAASRAIASYDIRCPGPEAPVRFLSGGNMQKVILARAFNRDPRLVLADQPTRGLDVGAATEVHRRLLDAKRRGAAIVLVSEDLDELLAICDRVAVLTRGRLSEPQPVESVTLAELGLAMAGHRAEQDRAAA